MKISDYVAQFIKEQNIQYVFCVIGGASLHLIHSLKNKKINYICNQHEQACAMCADGYSRTSGNLGVTITTSGPGATNLITGIACAYYDSIPCLFITGQVATFRQKNNTGTRQIGFQETDIVNIVKPITKYAVKIENENQIAYEFNKAVNIAKSNRPGPVLIDIPDDLQRKDYFGPKYTDILYDEKFYTTFVNFDKLYTILLKSKKPLLILGAGIKLAKAQKEIIKLIQKLQIPFVSTWAAADLIDNNNILYAGTFGTHGTKYGNLAIQNADLILSIGSRLDTKATGSPPEWFAPNATKVMVDIDPFEINKFRNLKINLSFTCDAKYFIQKLLDDNIKIDKLTLWIQQIQEWKKQNDYSKIEPYTFFYKLSQLCTKNNNIVLDTGCLLPWMMQSFKFKEGQILLHDWNNTAMGWALPAGIGAYLANKKRTICLIGDGSMHMNIQELATIRKHNIPLKIFVINNGGYSMIKQTQDQWLDSNYIGSSSDDLPQVNFAHIARAYNITAFRCDYNLSYHLVEDALNDTVNPIVLDILFNPNDRVKDQVKFGEKLC